MSRAYRMLFSGFLLMLSVLFFPGKVSGQTQSARPTRQHALELYGKSDYDGALTEFTLLSEQYPGDPFYKYYRGVILVKLERNPLLAEKLLSEAARGSVTVKTVPPDVMFWTGRARQMAGMFKEATEAYNMFYESAGKKVSKEYRVEEYIGQCSERKGMVLERVIVPLVDTSGVKEVQPVNPRMAAKDSVAAVPVATVLSLPDSDDKLLGLALAKKGNPDSASYYLSEILGDRDPQLQSSVSVSELPLKPAEDIAEKGTPVFSVFHTGKDPLTEKILINGDVPPGLIYRIQVAVFRNPVAPVYFKGLSPINGFTNDQNGITTYYAGTFRKYSDAQPALNKVKGEGFKDAFIAALLDKKPVSMERAAFLEKEWGEKPLFINKPVASANNADTIPPTLVFRVEVLRSPKPVPADKLEELKKVAGARGLDIIVNDSKQNIYIIGKFLTFKSATEFSDLLVRNGYRESAVKAYIGNREIPVETARQLFEDDK